MPCGTYDPLWPISRRSTAWIFSSEPPVSLTKISSFWNIVVILDCPGQVFSPLPAVDYHVYVWIFFLFSCSTACLVLSEVLLLEYFVLEFSLGELMQGYSLLLWFSLCNPKSYYWQFTPLSQNGQICVVCFVVQKKVEAFSKEFKLITWRLCQWTMQRAF